MAYRIQYGCFREPDPRQSGTGLQIRTAVCAGILTGVLALRLLAPEKTQSLELFLTGEPAGTTERATQTMAQSISSGGRWKDGLAAFCAELLAATEDTPDRGSLYHGGGVAADGAGAVVPGSACGSDGA